MKPVKIYLTERERGILKERAAKCELSVSAFVKDLLSDVWDEDESLFCEWKQETKRNRFIQIRVTTEEYERIRHLAGDGSLSSYARRSLLSGKTPISIFVATDDIVSFDFAVSEKLQHFQNVIEALAYRSVLQPQESEKLLSLLTEIRDEMKEMTHYARNNRQSIRNAGLRWLKKKYHNERKKMS